MRRREFISLVASVGAWTLSARAQGRMPTIGVLVLGNPPPDLLLRILRDNLAMRGYVEGQNIAFVVRSAEGQTENLPKAAAELVRQAADVIVTWQTPATAAARRATTEIPIVMAGVGDPQGNGFIASLARPGGNITGMAGGGVDYFGKFLDLLREMLPTARRVAILANAADPFAPTFLKVLQGNAQAAGIELQIGQVRPSDDVEKNLAGFANNGAEALILQPTLFRPAIAALLLKYRLPSISGAASFAAAGGLMSYTSSQAELFAGAAGYVERILKGDVPAELPVAQPTTYELALNLRTANALGLTVPPSLLVRADEVIE